MPDRILQLPSFQLFLELKTSRFVNTASCWLMPSTEDDTNFAFLQQP